MAETERVGVRSLARQVDAQERDIATLQGGVNVLSVQMASAIEKITTALNRLTEQEKITHDQERDALRREVQIAKEYVSIERCEGCSLRVRLEGEGSARNDVVNVVAKLGPMVMVVIAALMAMYVSISNQQAVQEVLRQMNRP